LVRKLGAYNIQKCWSEIQPSSSSITVRNACHSTHHAQHVVVHGVHTDLGRVDTSNRGARQDKLQSSIVNAREVARAGGLVLLRAEGERVHVDARVGVAGVVLEGLDLVEVGALTLREAVLAVKLELGGDHGVLAPAVHVKGGLGENEGAGIGHIGAVDGLSGAAIERNIAAGSPLLVGSEAGVVVHGTSLLEETRGVDESGGTGGLLGTTEGVDGVGESINGVRVVEGLGTQSAVKHAAAVQRGAVVDVGVGLDNPDELLARVVEVQLDLVRRGADRLVAGELQLLNEVLVGVLGHLAALIRVEENVVHVQGGGNQGLLVSSGHRLNTRKTSEGLDSPEALTNGAEVDIDLHLVVLQGDQGQSQTGVAAEPEKEGNVEGGLGESVAGSAHLSGAGGRGARALDAGEGGVRDVGKLSGVANHLEVSALLLGRHGELVPDVHPVTVLAIDALATNLHLNLGDELLTDEVQPAGPDVVHRAAHLLVDLGESHLQVSTVAKITVTGDGAGHAATEVGLTREGLLNGFHGKVCVAPVRHLPESNLGCSRKEHVLSAVGDKLHQRSTH